ncbi:MAG: hypothetical protein AVO35_04825 [Candidatus Aegiribacteria sp. MLS_C]|nr:MAG: hypothetical protein AVO35_04825 [Candidatus Aegiribacteria sp. MLS_C]
MKELDHLSELHFEEFLEICSDSGLVGEEVAREIINFAKAIGGVGAVPRLTGKQLHSTDDFAATLVSTYPEDMTFNNYVTTEENYYATEIARTIALIPRVWKSITPVMLHANTGQGKTHLLAAISRATHKRTLILNTVDLHIEYQQCLKAGIERELRDWITTFDLLLLDDIQFSQGDMMFQKFIISVINRMPRGKHGIITSSDVHPGELLDIDASFYSRLTSGLVIKLETVNLEGRKEILSNLFSQTGIKTDDEIIEYIATNVKLNVRQLKAAGRMVLAQMLGPGHEVTLEIVKDILNFMQVSRRDQPRPKASELNVHEAPEIEHASVTHTPYIVVDIDEENRGGASGGYEEDAAVIPEEPVVTVLPDASPQEPEETVTAEPGTEDVAETQRDRTDARMPAMDLEDRREPPEIPDEHIFEEETGQTGGGGAAAGTQKYRSMVESAQSVENQIETLKLAVADRIEQLQQKRTDSKEIEKLRNALDFLNQGKLESAMKALRP